MALPPLFHITENLGAVQIPVGSLHIQFRLFFPAGFDTQITSIHVTGNFQSKIGSTDWDHASALSLTKTSAPMGDFWTCLLDQDLPTGFYEYKYIVTFTDASTRDVSDPCARYSGKSNMSSGFVIGGSLPADNVVTPLSVRKPLRDLVVYELHASDFTDAFRGTRAPLDAITDKLDYFDSLGINAILIEPWTAWKDKDFDWGYAPFQYFAVEYAYANDLNQPTEKISWLKKLISACHKKDIHVIMDGVYNHADESFPYKSFYLNEGDCPYTAQPFGGTFPGLQDLDFNNQCTQDFIRDVCLYWISEFGIDGIRFDNTVNYYVPGNPRGLPDLLQSIQDYVDADGQKNFSMTLEHLDMDAANLVNTTAATSYWDNGLFGNCFGQLWSGSIAPNYLAVLNNSQYVNGDKVATMYLSNHDHSTVAWQAGSNSLDGAFKWFRTQPHVIALLTGNGTPLIASGQEFAEDYWIPEDDHGSGRRVRPRPLRWTEVTDSYGSKLLPLYRTLLSLRHAHPALRSPNFYPPKWADWQTQRDQNGFGVDTAAGIVVYHRWGANDDGVQELFYVALNFSANDQQVTIQFAENGDWSDVLSGNTLTVNNYRLAMTLESNWGHILFKQSS